MEFASSPFDKPKAAPIPDEEVIVLSLEEYVQYLLLRVFSGCPTTPEHWYTGLSAVAALEYAQVSYPFSSPSYTILRLSLTSCSKSRR